MLSNPQSVYTDHVVVHVKPPAKRQISEESYKNMESSFQSRF